MKRLRLGAILSVLVLVMALTVGSVAAQAPAYTTAFTTSITYQNISTDAATISITFYGTGTPYTYNREEPLAAGAGTSLFVGGLNNVESGFRGAAVLSSNAPIVATMVQVPQNNAEVKNRPLSNGFTGDQGASRYLIPTALRTRFQATTIFSAQNVDSVALDITANFYEVAENTPTATITRQNVQPGASTYFDLGQIAEIPENFNGSAVVTAAHTGNAATAGRIVASAMELGTQGNSVAAQYRAAAFEGSRQGAETVYMSTALCNAFGGQTTAYAVQNTTNAQITVTVTYYTPGVATPAGSLEKQIAGNAKESFIACDAGVGNNFSGSAVVESSTTDSIVAIGKKFVAQGILTTAFAGSSVGSNSLALPYVRWATATNYQAGNDRGQRAFIAIQNVGADAVTGVQVLYKNPEGQTVCTHDLAQISSGQKLNSNVGANCPALADSGFGYWPNGTFGGSVIVQGPAGSQLQAIATIQSSINGVVVAEDYNGIPTAD